MTVVPSLPSSSARISNVRAASVRGTARLFAQPPKEYWSPATPLTSIVCVMYSLPASGVPYNFM